MRIRGFIEEDFVQYKKPSMVLMMPHCNWKCGKDLCQNEPIAKVKIKKIDLVDMVKRYALNPITKALVFSGLEPFCDFEEMRAMIGLFREMTNDVIVIYTGYEKEEIPQYLDILKEYPNIVVKFGRYLPNRPSIYNELLGVTLASDNQYAEKIS